MRDLVASGAKGRPFKSDRAHQHLEEMAEFLDPDAPLQTAPDRTTRAVPVAVPVAVDRVLSVPVVGIWIIFVSMVTSLQRVADFRAFYGSAYEWRMTGHFYTPDMGHLLNLNWPPIALLVVPLTWVPLLPALLLWQTVQTLALLDSIRRLRLSGWQAALVAVWMPVLFQTDQGQWSGVLTWLVVRAIQGSIVSLGLAIVLKPFLAPMWVALVLLRQWRAVLIAALVVLVALSAGALIAGPASYLEWMTAVRSVPWTGNPANLSLFRWTPTAVAIGIGLSLLTLSLTWSVQTQTVAWASLLPACLLATPLGWHYYAVILLPTFGQRPRIIDGLVIGALALPWYLIPGLGTGALLVAWWPYWPGFRISSVTGWPWSIASCMRP